MASIEDQLRIKRNTQGSVMHCSIPCTVTSFSTSKSFQTQVAGTPPLHNVGLKKILVETLNNVDTPQGVHNLSIRYA